MGYILSAQDYIDRLQADPSRKESICHPEPFETQYTWCSAMDQGWFREMQLRDLWLTIEENQVKRDVIYKAEAASWGPVSSFFVSGTLKNRHIGLTEDNLEAPGGHYLECVQDGVETDQWFAGEQVVRLRFGLKADAMQQFAASSGFPHELQAIPNGDSPSSFYRQGRTTPEMQVILHQILHCPYRGSIRQMYLEAKVLELAALQFFQFTEQADAPASLSLKTDDIERLYQARDLLIQQFDQPPSLIALARQVGLNDFKLKQGFRQVFGTTVFGYLRNYRLEQARLLLQDGQLSVRQVAQAIGYAHSGYFANAFKRKFGINPKTYQSHTEVNPHLRNSFECLK
ncbi:helix-turn-helix domain-containing protein [Synechococcales cyanobacterium C]|uniref:Helix-turn-helix domain-containing protein n=1 Tax=Petrachloros mirabilis ULC683 TaxID=2781853 RepID=A0A8K2A2K0_9CYAN|nr:AraC family transcriptional regulator [Petrachloros mirabilis]NCJ08648.1 helix-turn-helix domain-containing protein [Petrachloros mirabilis ULC683]